MAENETNEAARRNEWWQNLTPVAREREEQREERDRLARSLMSRAYRGERTFTDSGRLPGRQRP